MSDSLLVLRDTASRGVLAFALSIVASPAWSLPVEVGQPTYYSSSTIDDDRGDASPAYVNSRIVRGWNGQGSTQVSVYEPRPNQVDPTRASGRASATELSSLALATGPTGYPDGQTPYVIARNRSETTRYWEFTHPGQSSTGFAPLVMGFDGRIGGSSIHELLQQASSRLSFGLDLIDANNTLLGNIFTVGAELTYTPFSSDLWTLAASATGAAIGTGWEQSFSRQTGASFVDHIYDFDYLANMTTFYAVPTNQRVGLRWFLETEGMFEGALVFQANIGVDASHTATFDSTVSAANLRAGATATEVLSIPGAVGAVPEPASFALLLGGLLGLGGRHRR